MRFNWKYSAGVKKIGKRYELWWYRSLRYWDFGIMFNDRPLSVGRDEPWNITIAFFGLKAVLTKYKNEKTTV